MLFLAFSGADIDGNSTMTPMEFMTWFEKNYGRMVRKGIRPRVSEERLYELACGTFYNFFFRVNETLHSFQRHG